MKKILLLLFIIITISCETNTIEIEKTSGDGLEEKVKVKNICWLMTSILSLRSSLWMLIMDPETMVEMTKDTFSSWRYFWSI